MDVVITYVNCFDKEWQKEYASAMKSQYSIQRFRDWGTLRYLLRGIENFMPFIRNVYLVVSSKSQVPDWANTDNLKIVEHKEIIPEEFLPTFNSCTIEMFLHKIKGLDEQYVYFNDDFFPVQLCEETDFFIDNKPCYMFYKCFETENMYRVQCKNADKLARKHTGTAEDNFYMRQQHICTPMLKSSCEKIFELAKSEIFDSISRAREEKNINQYLFSDYNYYTSNFVEKAIDYKYFSLVREQWQIKKFFDKPTAKLICLNDTADINHPTFKNFQKNILLYFNRLLPDKSKYEI